MSITHLSIRNFQSLRSIDLDLGLFTVIVGPSSSGKSALIRAFKALASNVRGSGVITRGQKVMAISARTETHVVTLERSERAGAYRIAGDGTSLTFTKLAGEVPEQVTRALQIDPVSGDGGSLSFAQQFDKPYLLDESGATVARVLGELTNVTTIFEAVRAANRIRTNAASALKTRQNDLEQVKTRLVAFTGLSERLKALDEAEQIEAHRAELDNRAGRLATAIKAAQIAHCAAERADVPEAPDPAELNALANRYLDLEAALNALAAKQTRLSRVSIDLRIAEKTAAQLEQEVAAAQAAAGTCPTCGQPVR